MRRIHRVRIATTELHIRENAAIETVILSTPMQGANPFGGYVPQVFKTSNRTLTLIYTF